jgi:hypothetical protein
LGVGCKTRTLGDMFDKVKQFLNKEESGPNNDISVLPITHNPGLIILQMMGWSINLKSDGTWYCEATDGG